MGAAGARVFSTVGAELMESAVACVISIQAPALHCQDFPVVTSRRMAAQSPVRAIILTLYFPWGIFVLSSIGIHLPACAIQASPDPVLYLMDSHVVGDATTRTTSNSLVDVAARTGSVDSVNTDAQSTATSMDFLISGFLVSIVTRDPNAHLDHCGYVPIEIDLKQHVQVVNVSKRDGCVQLKNMNPPINRLTGVIFFR